MQGIFNWIRRTRYSPQINYAKAIAIPVWGLCEKRKKMSENKIPLNPKVAAVFDSYPKNIKSKLLFLRKLIYDTSASIESIGEIEETLKWGEPSYLTPISKSESTIRIAWKGSKKEQYSMFLNAQQI